jgi:hypothetical protein
MGRYRKMLLVTVLLATAGCRKADDPAGDAAGWELKPSLPDAAPVMAKGKLTGIYLAGSRIEDVKAIGGFGRCDNFPKALDGKEWGKNATVSIVAFPDEPVAYSKYQGFALRVVNRTAGAIPFVACDSALSLVCEGLDASGEWRGIESLPESPCGNSYHSVFLGPGQYWEFPSRLYSGPKKTKLRFRLDPGDSRPAIYSNEFDGKVTAAQFEG